MRLFQEIERYDNRTTAKPGLHFLLQIRKGFFLRAALGGNGQGFPPASEVALPFIGSIKIESASQSSHSFPYWSILSGPEAK
jgi:hypothetical protein